MGVMGIMHVVHLILMLYMCKTLHFCRKDFTRDSSIDSRQNNNDSKILHFYRIVIIIVNNIINTIQYGDVIINNIESSI